MSTVPPPTSAATSAASRSSPPLWIAAAAAIGMGAAFFSGNFAKLAHTWDIDDNYSHGWLVGPISLGLAWRIWRRVGPPVRGELGWGLFAIAFGVGCQLSYSVVSWPPLGFVALLAVIRGLLVCAGGRAWASAFNFPLLFLFFMFPLPAVWTGYAALWLQDIVSRVSETVIGLFFVCHRVGHTIKIAGVEKSLVVAQECSGLGQIVSFLAFAALLGHLFDRPLRYRIALFIAAVPIAVAANTLRVVLMNLGAVYFGTNWMNGKLHDAPALFSLPVGIALFLFFDFLLTRITERGSAGAASPAPPSPAPPLPAAPSRGPAPAGGVLAGAFVLVLGVAGQFALARHLNAAGEASYPMQIGPFSSIPLTITKPDSNEPLWIGGQRDEALEKLRAKLPFHTDDLLLRDYRNPDKTYVSLYMVHSREAEDRKHHPEICIRDVSGAPEDIKFRRMIPLRPGTDETAASAQRFRFEQGVGRSTVVYYWHYTFAPTQDPTQTALQRVHQRLGTTAPSITVQVSVGTDNPATLEAIETQLLPAIDAAARQGVLPPGTVAGCNRVPIALAR